MTLYSLIVLGLFVLMWALCSYEIRTKDSIIRKLDKEAEELNTDYNKLVNDYNKIVDFLEQKYSPEELRELFLDQEVEDFLGDGVNEKVKATFREHLKLLNKKKDGA